MKNKIFFASILFSLIVVQLGQSSATSFNVDIKEQLSTAIMGLPFNETYYELPNVIVDLFNSGSTSYKARLRLEVFKENETVFTAWTKEKDFLPAFKDFYNIYWITNESGNYTARVRAYYGNEIQESPMFSLGLQTKDYEDVFQIMDFKTYKDRMTFKIKSLEDVNGVVAFPKKIPLGWIIEQVEIGDLKKDRIVEVTMPYNPSYFLERELPIVVASKDGSYLSEATFHLKLEKTFREKLIDFINYLFGYN